MQRMFLTVLSKGQADASVAALTVISIRPTELPPAVTSKKTTGLDMMKSDERFLTVTTN